MKNKLVGWDDGKLYFYDEDGKEFCVNDYQELLEQMIKMCAVYLKQKERKEETGK
jgi:hypothetical protein